jgi:hypothetical protein
VLERPAPLRGVDEFDAAELLELPDLVADVRELLFLETRSGRRGASELDVLLSAWAHLGSHRTTSVPPKVCDQRAIVRQWRSSADP